MHQFKIVQESSSQELEKKVQKYLDDGWKVINVWQAEKYMLDWCAALIKDEYGDENGGRFK